MPNPTPPTDGTPVQPEPNEVAPINIPQDQVPQLLANAPHPDQTQTYPVTINGQVEQWDLAKLTAEAQRGAAGQIAFENATTQRRENARAIAIAEDMEMVFKERDADAFRRIGAQFGVAGDKLEEVVQGTFGAEGGLEDDPEGDEQVVNSYLNEQANEIRSRTTEKVDYAALSPDVQRILREAEKTRIDGIVKAALDKDETIAYNMGAQTPEGRGAIIAYVNEKIRGRLDSHAGDFGDGARILAEVLPEIKTHLQALGTPGQRTHTGLGQAPGGGDTEVHPTKLPDHVPSTEGDAFEQNVLETLAFHQSQVERGKS